jgi:hypothetical protein
MFLIWYDPEIQKGVEDGTAILLIGNKTDMAESESDRVVKIKDGNKLSVVC